MDKQTTNANTGDTKYRVLLDAIRAELQSMKEAILKVDFDTFAASKN